METGDFYSKKKKGNLCNFDIFQVNAFYHYVIAPIYIPRFIFIGMYEMICYMLLYCFNILTYFIIKVLI